MSYQRIVVLSINEQNNTYTISPDSYFVHITNETCREEKNVKKKIVFYLICGYELNQPKIDTLKCVINVFIVDTKFCDQRVCDQLYYFNLNIEKINILFE